MTAFSGTRLRVLHVIPTLAPTGGAETSLLQSLRPLARLGVDTTVVTLQPHPDPGPAEQARSWGFDVRVLGTGSPLGQLRRLVTLIREVQPDLVHTTLVQAGIPGRLAAKVTRTPAVHSVVNTVYLGGSLTAYGAAWKARVFQALEWFVSRHATTAFHALTQSSAADAVAALGVPTRRITVIPRGRDAALLGERSADRRTDTRKALGLPLDAPVLVNVARQERQKGQAHLVAAFDKVLSEIPAAHLLVAGRPGAATADIERTIDELGLRERVHLLGARDDVAELLCAADVFVFSSLWEGLGGAVLEAMALCLPVVTFAVPAVCEVVGDTAVTVPVGDEAALAAAVVSVLGDDDLRLDLSARARERFDERFQIDAVAAKTSSWYRQVVAN